MDPLRLGLYQGQSPWGGWENLLFLPWQATISGLEGAPGFGASIGPLLLALGILFLIAWRTRSVSQQQVLRAAGIFTLVGLVVWALAGRVAGLLIQARLYTTLFPAVALLAGAGFDGLERIKLPGVRLGRLAGVVILLVFGFNLLEMCVSFIQQGVPNYILGLSTSDDYSGASLGMTSLAYKAVNDLPEDARVLMLWEPRSFYCAPRCVPDEILDRWLVDRARYGTDKAIVSSWLAKGYTHLLVYQTGAEFYRSDPRYSPQDWQVLDNLLTTLPIQTNLNQIYTLYTLTP